MDGAVSALEVLPPSLETAPLASSEVTIEMSGVTTVLSPRDSGYHSGRVRSVGNHFFIFCPNSKNFFELLLNEF